MTDKRVVILTDGQVTIGGVVCKLVPVEPTHEMYRSANFEYDTPPNRKTWFNGYRAMLSAATIDLSGLPRVPERLPDASVNLNDTIERIAFKDGRVMGFNEALDAMGIK